MADTDETKPHLYQATQAIPPSFSGQKVSVNDAIHDSLVEDCALLGMPCPKPEEWTPALEETVRLRAQILRGEDRIAKLSVTRDLLLGLFGNPAVRQSAAQIIGLDRVAQVLTWVADTSGPAWRRCACGHYAFEHKPEGCLIKKCQCQEPGLAERVPGSKLRGICACGHPLVTHRLVLGGADEGVPYRLCCANQVPNPKKGKGVATDAVIPCPCTVMPVDSLITAG